MLCPWLLNYISIKIFLKEKKKVRKGGRGKKAIPVRCRMHKLKFLLITKCVAILPAKKMESFWEREEKRRKTLLALKQRRKKMESSKQYRMPSLNHFYMICNYHIFSWIIYYLPRDFSSTIKFLGSSKYYVMQKTNPAKNSS